MKSFFVFFISVWNWKVQLRQLEMFVFFLWEMKFQFINHAYEDIVMNCGHCSQKCFKACVNTFDTYCGDFLFFFNKVVISRGFESLHLDPFIPKCTYTGLRKYLLISNSPSCPKRAVKGQYCRSKQHWDEQICNKQTAQWERINCWWNFHKMEEINWQSLSTLSSTQDFSWREKNYLENDEHAQEFVRNRPDDPEDQWDHWG